jgi:GNAT superfamily N-acetyltransferase
MIATRTFLEMREPHALRPGRPPSLPFTLERMEGASPAFWRFLYTEVGRRYRWVDRLDWSDAEISAYLADPAVSLWVLTVEDQPTGYFELRQDGHGGVEIAYLGVVHAFHGQGLGGHLLTVATREAWALGATRVWLHTSDLDDPAALPNYLSRGFEVTHKEHYIISI